MKEIQTTSGKLTGMKTDYGYAFLGIPYAHAERFCAPTESEWEGIRECVSFTPQAFQCTDQPEKCGEDCLSLNIYTPDIFGSYPVVIDIHGGGFQGGCNSPQYRHPERFVQDRRCIYIPIQYRLGIWGYLDLSGELGDEYATSGNCGTLDQVAAIRWVSQNIAHFGGNPNHITLMGNSAGAKAIGALLTIPECKGLFSQVLTMSGSMQCIRTPETSRTVARNFIDILGCEAKELLTMPNEMLLEAQRKLTTKWATCMFGPVSDGIVIPKNWKEIIRTEDTWRGAAYIGSNRHENANLVHEVDDFLGEIDEIIEALFGTNSSFAREAYIRLAGNRVLDDKEQTELWEKVISDYMYRTHSDRLASILAKRGMNVWQYSFEWLPAYHDMDRRFAWYELDWKCEGIPEEKINVALRLSRQIYESFMAFIVNGNPNCPELPYLNPVTESHLTKWMFGENTFTKEWGEGEFDAINELPEDVYCLKEREDKDV